MTNSREVTQKTIGRIPRRFHAGADPAAAAFPFPSGFVGELVATATDDLLRESSTRPLRVVVGNSPLVAVVDGGDRTVGASDGATMSCRGSYDPDAPAAGQPPLDFEWNFLDAADGRRVLAAVGAEVATPAAVGVYEARVVARRPGRPPSAPATATLTVVDNSVPAVTCVESQPIQDTFNLSVPERIFGGSLSSRRELGERIRTVQESWETSSI